MSSCNATSDTQPNDYLPEFDDFSINSNFTLPTVESVSTPQGATSFIPSRPENTLNTVPKDCHQYLTTLTTTLEIIRNEVKSHVIAAQSSMLDRQNDKILNLSEGDYVYLSKDPSGPGHKFKYKYTGPYAVDKCNSPHLITLKDPMTGKNLPSPVHINRLKMAYVRKPTPMNYFLDKVATNNKSEEHATHSEAEQLINDSDVSMDNTIVNRIDPPTRKSKRQLRKPIRYQDSSFTDGDASAISDGNKIKRVLARRNINGEMKYLVNHVGEPAQNAVWKDYNSLTQKAKQLLITRHTAIHHFVCMLLKKFCFSF